MSTISLKKAKEAQGASKAGKKTDAKNKAKIKSNLARKAADLMYKYPSPDMEQTEKKKFRAKARRKLATGRKLLKSKKGDDLTKFQKKFNAWVSKTYTAESMPTI